MATSEGGRGGNGGGGGGAPPQRLLADRAPDGNEGVDGVGGSETIFSPCVYMYISSVQFVGEELLPLQDTDRSHALFPLETRVVVAYTRSTSSRPPKSKEENRHIEVSGNRW